MTNEQQLLCYLYTVPFIQRKQLPLALPDIPYQSITWTTRKAIEHGYVELFKHNETTHVRITPDGIHYIRAACQETLDSQKRKNFQRTLKDKSRRTERLEVTRNLCKSAGIVLAKESGIKFEELLTPASEGYERFFEEAFESKGIFIQSDELSAAIKTMSKAGEEYHLGMSRLAGIILNSTGVYYVYCTLDRLMRCYPAYEARRVTAITNILQSSETAHSNKAFAQAVSQPPRSITIGKNCAMIPKIVTGDKYGAVRDKAPSVYVTKNLMHIENLRSIYSHNYFVPNDQLGVELLSRTVTFTRQRLNATIEAWLKQTGTRFVTVEAGEYLVAYRGENEHPTLVFPVIEFEELLYHKAGTEPYHIVCERGLQEGISRVMGNKLIGMRDFDDEEMPFHKYDDNGIRRDGINPLTKNGYKEKEQ